MGTYSTREDWLALKAKASAGTFNPKAFNWAVGENAVPVSDESATDGWKYEKRVCVYIMCDGGEQCFGEFPLTGPPSPEKWEVARRLIKDSFGVERILNGVG